MLAWVPNYEQIYFMYDLASIVDCIKLYRIIFDHIISNRIVSYQLIS